MPGLWRQLRQLWHDYQNFGVKARDACCAFALFRPLRRASADAPRRAQELAALKKHNAEMRAKVEEARGSPDAAAVRCVAV